MFSFNSPYGACPGCNGLGRKQEISLDLLVHPYTFRCDELPVGISSFSELLDIFFRQVMVDGVFTDFPDIVCHYLRAQAG